MSPTEQTEPLVAAAEAAMAQPSLECLLFSCCGLLLGGETCQIAKVIRPPRLVPLPRASGVVAGLLNYRGRIIGAIDIQPLLAVDRSVAPAWQWLVVLKGKGFLTGLLVEEVVGIETIPETALFNTSADQPGFLPKTFTSDDQQAFLLAVDSLLANPAVLVNQ